jgi:DNA replication protein DnaC
MPEAPGEIFGRSTELARIQQFLRGLQRDGKAWQISGQAGVGKPALLGAAGAAAERMGIRVLRTVGSEFETDAAR